MSIFVTSKCPFECAEYLDDKRVIKMVLETAQLLSTAARACGYEGDDVYKSSHVNHPCSKWVRETKQNYMWTMRHFRALCIEYTRRYGRMHKSSWMYPSFLALSNLIPEGEMTEFVNCTKDVLDASDVFDAYKKYLNLKWESDKRQPTWFSKAA